MIMDVDVLFMIVNCSETKTKLTSQKPWFEHSNERSREKTSELKQSDQENMSSNKSKNGAGIACLVR